MEGWQLGGNFLAVPETSNEWELIHSHCDRKVSTELQHRHRNEGYSDS